MQQLLSKFFVIKSVIYLIGFSILWYLVFTKGTDSSPLQESVYSTGVNQICSADRCIDVEIADDEQERTQW